MASIHSHNPQIKRDSIKLELYAGPTSAPFSGVAIKLQKSDKQAQKRQKKTTKKTDCYLYPRLMFFVRFWPFITELHRLLTIFGKKITLSHQNDNFWFKNDNLWFKNDNFWFKNDNFWFKNDNFWVKNDNFWFKNDNFWFK